MKDGLMDNYYADINVVSGQMVGKITAFELSEALLNSQFR